MMQRKHGYTVIEFIVVAAILLTLVGLLWPAVSAARSAATRPHQGVDEPKKTVRLESVQHDGHWWVISDASYTVPAIFQHHPDCPCLSRKAESEAN